MFPEVNGTFVARNIHGNMRNLKLTHVVQPLGICLPNLSGGWCQWDLHYWAGWVGRTWVVFFWILYTKNDPSKTCKIMQHLNSVSQSIMIHHISLWYTIYHHTPCISLYLFNDFMMFYGFCRLYVVCAPRIKAGSYQRTNVTCRSPPHPAGAIIWSTGSQFFTAKVELVELEVRAQSSGYLG